MATNTLGGATLQVRPYPTGGAWNAVTLTNGIAQKSTTFGVTLKDGQNLQVRSASGQFLQGASGSHARLAQKRARACGVELRAVVNLATGQTTAAVTANVFDRVEQSGFTSITIVTTIGATPTCTYQLEGSSDNGSWAVLSSADSATPTTFSTATFAITSATTTVRFVNPASTNARYIRLTLSAVTNVTSTIDAAAY